MVEEWRDIKGFEGLYQVSDLGNVRSIDRVIITNKGKEQHWNGKLLTPFTNGTGYLCVHLKKNNKRYMKYVHRLVVESIFGDISNMDINHKDFDRTNNKLSNLEILTRFDNIHYSIKHGKYKDVYSNRNKLIYNRKHKELLDILKLIKENNEENKGMKYLENKYHFDRRTLIRHNLSIN